VGAFAKCDNAFDDISKPICFTNNRVHLIVLRQYSAISKASDMACVHLMCGKSC
jgi:hypothetical protein